MAISRNVTTQMVSLVNLKNKKKDNVLKELIEYFLKGLLALQVTPL